jgi:hypothetical protein
MRTLIFVTAENASASQDGKLNIFAIFNVINATQFPTMYARLTLVIKLGLEAGEEPKNRKVTVYFTGEDANVQKAKLGEFNVDFPPRIGGIDPENVLVLSINAIFLEKPGTYQFLLHVDDRFLSSLSLFARQIDQPPQVIQQNHPPQLGG